MIEPNQSDVGRAVKYSPHGGMFEIGRALAKFFGVPVSRFFKGYKP